MAKFNTGQSFADGDQVTGAKLNNIVGLLDIYSGVIADQTAIAATVSTADLLLIADTDAGSSGAANKVTIGKLLNDTLTGGTFTNANIAEQLTYGTATGNRTISTSATITTGTIPNLTAGTTTSTAATITNGTITTALIPTLTAGTTTGTAGIFTSGTIASLNSTAGTIASLNSTAGTIATLNSTTGTITNLSTTLAGDFTISQGTGTLATSGATAGTYGSVTAIPFITVDSKGRITSATTGTFSSTPADGSITFAKLSTSTTEADNVAKRIVKAWVNFDGTTNVGGNCTIRDDFNVSTVADNGTGDYTVNFTTAMDNGNYCVASTGKFIENDGSSTVLGVSISNRASNPAAGSVRVVSGQANNGTQFDFVTVCVSILS
jgi:hypothetical protein